MQVIDIKGQLRNDLGKKGAREIRKQELIPCVMIRRQGSGTFSTAFNDIRNLVYTPDFKIAQVDVDGKTFKCILKR